MDKRILVINPGSTSTKLALFQGEQKLFDAAVRHSKEDLSPFSWVMEQADFRIIGILQFFRFIQHSGIPLHIRMTRYGELHITLSRTKPNFTY